VKKYIFLVLVSFAALTTYCKADIVYLKNGKEMECEVISETDKNISVRLPLGPGGEIVYTLEKTEITGIKEAPLSYSFAGEAAVPAVAVGNRFSVDNLIKSAFERFLSGEEEKKAAEEVFKKVKAYMASSPFAGVLADFILAFLALSAFGVLRKDPQAAAGAVGSAGFLGLVVRLVLFALGIVIIQVQRFGTFDFVGSGIIPLFLLVTIVYVAIETVIRLFFKSHYIKLISAGGAASFMVFRIPLAAELVLFTYLFIMDILKLFI